MRVNRGQLLEALARVEPGRSTRDFLEQSSCYVFQNAWIATFNDEICCRTKSGLDPAFTGAVHGGPLRAVLENMADEEIELIAKGNEMHVRGKRKRAGVRMEADILLPVEQVEAPAAWVDLPNPDEFSAAVRAVCACAGSGASGGVDDGFIASCVQLSPEGMEACDRRQAIRYEYAMGVFTPFLVRAKSLLPVANFAVTRMAETDNWVHFRNKTLVYSARRHLDEFMPLEELWAFRGTESTLPKGAVEAAKLGGVFSGEDKENDKVTVTMSDGHMRVRGAGAFGWAEADLDTSYRGAPLAFRLAPAMLEKLVTEHNTCEIGPGKLRVAGERWVYVTVLGAPSQETADAAPPEPFDDAEPEPAEDAA